MLETVRYKPMLLLAILTSLVFAAATFPTQTNSVYAWLDPTPTPTPENPNQVVLSRIDDIETRLALIEAAQANNRDLLDLQERLYGATVQRMEWMFGIFIAFITAAGLLIGIFGLSIVNRMVERAAEDWFKRYAEDRIEQRTQRAVAELQEKYDKQFAELYQRIERAFERGADK